MASNNLHGARAKININGKVVGIWNNISIAFNFSVIPAFILGRFTTASLTTCSVEPVTITASGFVVVDNSMFSAGQISQVKDLLQQEDLVLQIEDRQTGQPLATVKGCLPTSVTMGVSARDLMTGSNTYTGILLSISKTDGSTEWSGDEGPGSASLPIP